MNAKQKLLNDALNLVESDRHNDYGTPAENFKRIAALWSAYLGDLYDAEGNPVRIEAADVAVFMMLLKLGRERRKAKPDNILDLIGYALIYEEIKTEDER